MYPLRKMRYDNGFDSQNMLAESIGISNRATIARWEAGVSYPRARMIARLAKALNTTEGDIISAITEARNQRQSKGG